MLNAHHVIEHIGYRCMTKRIKLVVDFYLAVIRREYDFYLSMIHSRVYIDRYPSTDIVNSCTLSHSIKWHLVIWRAFFAWLYWEDILCAAFCTGTTMLATADYSGRIILWNIFSGFKRSVLQIESSTPYNAVGRCRLTAGFPQVSPGLTRV
jgi:hypothetical protein